MAESIVMYASRAQVKAERLGNTVLAQGLDHPLTYYTQGTADTRISRANATFALINNNLATLTNVTAANVTEMQNAIAAYAAVKDAPTIVKQTQKVQGTDQIAPFLTVADKAIDNMGLLLHSYFPDIDLSREFDLRRKLITVGVRHNNVSFTLQDAATDAPIATGTATCVYNGRTADTDETGNAELAEIKSGKQEFTIAAPGYTTQQLAVHVQRGTYTTVVVKMVAGSTPPPIHQA